MTSQFSISIQWRSNFSCTSYVVPLLLLTIQTGGLLGGFLVVPSDNLKTFLSNRIGGIEELRPYLPLWRSIPIKEGVLRIEVVEHDATSLDVPRIDMS